MVEIQGQYMHMQKNMEYLNKVVKTIRLKIHRNSVVQPFKNAKTVHILEPKIVVGQHQDIQFGK